MCTCSLCYPAQKGMRRITLSSVASTALTHFSKLCHKRFSKKKIVEYKICVLIFFYNSYLKHYSY